MKRFVLKLSIAALIFMITFHFVLSSADGYTDAFYKRFTTAKKKNLILGNSRAAQGLQPGVLKNITGKDFFNYSFTLYHSPYGPVYYNSIRKKLETSTEESVFVVTIDPWSISSLSQDPNDFKNFRENELSLAKTKVVNLNPNYFYLMGSYDQSFYSLMFDKRGGPSYLHDDGWLEVTIDMDSTSVRRRMKEKISAYSNHLATFKFSASRLESLKALVIFLKERGDVFLIRLPIHPELLKIEQAYMSDFGEKMAEVVLVSNGYLDLTNEGAKYSYTDGNHLSKESGAMVSKRVGLWINDLH